jgi:hypothetical protein
VEPKDPVLSKLKLQIAVWFALPVIAAAMLAATSSMPPSRQRLTLSVGFNTEYQRQAADLVAQQRMAQAAEDLLDVTAEQTKLAFWGNVVLVLQARNVS